MRLLVTGGSGFMAGHLLRHLRERHELYAIVREGGWRPEGVELIEQDLTAPLREERFPDRVDAVIHLAQSRRYRDFPDGARDIHGVNVGATLELLEYARRASAKSFLFASTGGLYGYSYERLVESDRVNPLNFYLASKYAAELLTASYQRFYSTVVLRFFFVYGPGQRGMLVPTLFGRVLSGEEVAIEGETGLRINPIHVQDAVRVFEPALGLGRSDVFNVAGDEVVSIEELVRLMEAVTGRTAVVRHEPSGRSGDLVGDNARMKEILGVRPAVSLDEGLRSLL